MRDERTSRDTKNLRRKKKITGGEQQHLHHQTKCKLDLTPIPTVNRATKTPSYQKT